MNADESRKFTEGLFQQSQIICDYLSEGVFDMIRAVLNKSPKEDTIYGLFCRVICFMKTLRKSNDNSDFQSIAHINRALLELATDLIILHHDDTDGYLKMRAWEESAKLKAAEKVVRYYNENKMSIPANCNPQKIFIDNNKAEIVQQRMKYWSRSNHPDGRWTGHKLDVDVKSADAKEGSRLAETYDTEYQRMNWFTHGSALAGLRHMEPADFMNYCGLSYAACGDLALLCAKISLKAFNIWEIYKDRWAEIDRNITMHMAKFVPNTNDNESC